MPGAIHQRSYLGPCSWIPTTRLQWCGACQQLWAPQSAPFPVSRWWDVLQGLLAWFWGVTRAGGYPTQQGPRAGLLPPLTRDQIHPDHLQDAVGGRFDGRL